MVMETLQIELHGATHAFPVLELRDRRKRGNPKKKWALVRATEILLFDVHDRSRGRFAAHLAKCSMDDGLLVAERAAVNSGILTDEELGAGKKRPPPRPPLLPQATSMCAPCCCTVLGAMRPLLDVESRSRCHKAALCPLPILVSALTECAPPCLSGHAPSLSPEPLSFLSQVWAQRLHDGHPDRRQAHASALAARDGARGERSGRRI